MINKFKKIVIKVGSSSIINEKTEKIRIKWLNTLCEDISSLTNDNKKIVIVSSGAIALGKKVISNNRNIRRLEDKQAAAAVGQIDLVNSWQKSLNNYKIKSAQLLLTLNDSEIRRNYLNVRKTISSLHKNNFIPIVNENDTVATEEIRYGDNDRLAARIAQISSADCLILLSNIDGLYKNDPSKNRNAKFIPKVEKINKKIEAMASNTVSAYGSGGMVTKISAAKTAMSSGCHMVISSGKIKNPIKL